MRSVDCPIADCLYSTGDAYPAIPASLLTVYSNLHIRVEAPAIWTKQKATQFYLFIYDLSYIQLKSLIS